MYCPFHKNQTEVTNVSQAATLLFSGRFSEVTASAASALTGGPGQGVTGPAVASRRLDMPRSASSQVRVAPPSTGSEAALSVRWESGGLEGSGLQATALGSYPSFLRNFFRASSQ